jgi:hypothetical protein
MDPPDVGHVVVQTEGGPMPLKLGKPKMSPSEPGEDGARYPQSGCRGRPITPKKDRELVRGDGGTLGLGKPEDLRRYDQSTVVDKFVSDLIIDRVNWRACSRAKAVSDDHRNALGRYADENSSADKPNERSSESDDVAAEILFKPKNRDEVREQG